MSQSTHNNFVIQDVVHHIYDEGYYRSSSSFWMSIRKLLRNLRLYVIIIIISCGVGYLAVSLPDLMKSATPSVSSFPGLPAGMSVNDVKSVLKEQGGSMDELKSRFDKLSDSEKESLKRQLGGR
jgi:hypothetical protein